MNYQSEDDLKADGFILTVNVWHTGKGSGKVYEKIVNEEGKDAYRVYFGVDVDGSVSPWKATSTQVQDVIPPVERDVEEVEESVEVEQKAEPAPEPSGAELASESTE